MRSKAMQMSLAGAAAVALWCAGPLQAGEGFENLTLSLSTSARSILPLEPLPITITLANETNAVIMSHGVIAPVDGAMNVQVAGKGEAFVDFITDDWVHGFVEASSKPLRPGFVEKRSGYLYYASSTRPSTKKGRYLMPESGTYRVRLVMTDVDTKRKLESNVLTLRAETPVGADAAAYKYLKKVPDAAFLRRHGERLQSESSRALVARQEEFLQRFAKSRYAPWLQYTLGRTYLRGVGKGVGAGMALLEKAAAYPHFFLAKEALAVLTKTALKRDDLEKAKHYHKQLQQRFPKSGQVWEAAILIRRKEREKARR